jgi:hypothetical protein
MKFSVWDYVSMGVLAPLILIVFLLFLAVAMSLKLARRNSSKLVIITPILMWLMVILGGMRLCAKGMEYPLTALIQKDHPIYTTKGQITDIVDAPAPPVYGFSLQPAKLVTINGETFYALTVDVEEGTDVIAKWSTDARIIYAFERIDPKNEVSDEPVVSQSDTTNLEKNPVGIWVLHMSIILFVVIVILQFPIGKAIAPRLIMKDREITNGVFSNKYGLFHYLIILCSLCFILVGMRLTGFYGIGLISIIALPVMIVILVSKHSLRITFQANVLIYKGLFHEQQVPLSYIDTVEWGKSSIPYNRQLIIRLKKGRPIILEQEHYWGLENLCNQLQQAIRQHE